MRRRRLTGLRARLLLATAVGSLLTVGALVAVFNVVLDAQLRRDVDSLLRERAAAQLRTLSIVDGRLQVPEAPDQASVDSQTWVFAGGRVYEHPNSGGANDRSARSLTAAPNAYATVPDTDTRLHAVPIVAQRQRLGTLVVGASLGPYRRSAHTALVASLLLGAVTVLGVALLGYWIIGRALAPVARMAAAAAAAADGGDHRVIHRFFPGEPHDELTALAATFDRLLSRLSAGLEREQRFTAEISHELRTPLAAIVAEAELALAREHTPEDYRRTLSAILFSAEGLGAALETLLTAARAGAGAGAGAPPVSAQVVATRAAAHGRRVAADPAVTVTVAPDATDLRVAAESELAERALIPIVDNAVRFARRRVEISMHAEGLDVIFEVSDDGPGVEDRLREHIFEPGVRSPAAPSGGSGAGLGLALARRLAHAAGGDVGCVARAAGARFVLRLPAG